MMPSYIMASFSDVVMQHWLRQMRNHILVRLGRVYRRLSGIGVSVNGRDRSAGRINDLTTLIIAIPLAQTPVQRTA